MRVVASILADHDLHLLMIAMIVAVAGGWVALGLFRRAGEKDGPQQQAWVFLAAVATGAAIWCAHFIVMLAYDGRGPFAFAPLLTLTSLVLIMAGSGAGFHIALRLRSARAAELGGATIGLAAAGMHYTGIFASRGDGLVDISMGCITASFALVMVLAALSLRQATRHAWPRSLYTALALLVAAALSLHVTSLAALTFAPVAIDASLTDNQTLFAISVAVAAVGLIVVGTSAASYVIDAKASQDMNARIHHLAYTDALTGLPNRAQFADQLGQDIDRAKADGSRVGIVSIDLDRFKEINDLRGLAAGDAALRIIGDRLTRLLVDGEFVARAGGDEFAAIKRFSDQNDLHDFIARLETALFERIRIGDFETVTGASLGVAIYPEDGDTQERLVNNSELAMYRSIHDSTRTTCYYEARMDEASRARNNLAQDLRHAIEFDQLEVHYQVQTDIASGDICGYEALLRWKHPVHGMVPPSDFIPIAEETGLILQIGEWVLRTACREAASWTTPHKVAVNLSPIQFSNADLARVVHEVLLQTDLSPSRLELELTESTIIGDKARTLHILRQLKALGVTIAIDDFGTGYSSLATLREFPFDKIKLDRSFMNEVEHSQQAKAVVRAVLSLGKTLEIKVLAEGVETAPQLAILRTEGCDEAQGYLLGRPQPIAQLTRPNIREAAAPVLQLQAS